MSPQDLNKVLTAEETESAEKPFNLLKGKILGAAVEVHRLLGPGLLESTYEQCLFFELMECGYRLDLLVENSVIIEIKAVSALVPISRTARDISQDYRM